MNLDLRSRLVRNFTNQLSDRPLHELSPTEFREKYAPLPPNLISNFITGKPAAMERIFNVQITVGQYTVPLRIYQPSNDKALPVVLYFHGGGWVIGDLDSHDVSARRIAHEANALVIAVDYPLAPENKFPAAAEGSYGALLWAVENSADYNGNPARLTVAGDSAGGNLAAVLSLMARDRGGPTITNQVLIYPTTDSRLGHPSVRKNADAPVLTADLIRYFINHYARTESDILDPYFSPLLADDHSNLPPAVVIVCEFDPLYDEGKAYAKRLREAGNRVQLVDCERTIHGFVSFANMAPKAKTAYQAIARSIMAS